METNFKSLSSPRRSVRPLWPSSTSRAPFATQTSPPQPRSQTPLCSQHIMVILFSSSPSTLVLIPKGLTPRRRLKVIINPKSGPVGTNPVCPSRPHLILHYTLGEKRANLPPEGRAYFPCGALPCRCNSYAPWFHDLHTVSRNDQHHIRL